MPYYPGPNVSDAAADTNSPFSLAAADAGTVHPLTVPVDAIGMIIINAEAAGNFCELVAGTTKGGGLPINGGNQRVYYFARAGQAETWHLNLFSGSTPVTPVTVHYIF